MTIEVNGIAHIQLTVANPRDCLPFWEKLCHFLSMQTLVKGDDVIYCIGARTGILIKGAPEQAKHRPFNQDQPGLHHFCFRAKSKQDVDEIHLFVRDQLQAKMIHGPEDGSHFAPGYYSILFEDPDGIRVEVNYVPGKGHFGDAGRLAQGGLGPASQYGEEGLTN
ncbi:MAG: VOC family protein [Pseudomonadota bacterium]|jgi:catechol 2,3-dioxygenase-like lactoylglutathione lyase family enzyme|nr:VOC family protein [Pseudomonadota bacterium]